MTNFHGPVEIEICSLVRFAAMNGHIDSAEK
jgi:hypothetical protein